MEYLRYGELSRILAPCKIAGAVTHMRCILLEPNNMSIFCIFSIEKLGKGVIKSVRA